MSRKVFDRFMMAVDNGHNLKLARLTDAEFRALVQGVWPIAAKADPRGAFMVGSLPATADDVVFMAPKVSRRTATACLAKLRELGMLEHDDELGGEWVHDWDTVNPAPKSDRTNADRQARYRDRRNAERNAVSNGDVTPPEVRRGEGNNPPDPPKGGRSRDIAEYEERLAAWSASVVPEADAHYCLPGVKHAISAISASRSMPTAESVRWYAANGSVNAFGLGDDVRAVIRSEFPSQAKEQAA